MQLAFPLRAAVLVALVVIAWGPCPGSVVTTLRKAFPHQADASPCCGCAAHAREEADRSEGGDAPCPCCDEQASRKNARTAEPVPALPTHVLAGTTPAAESVAERLEAPVREVEEDANGPPDGAPVGVVVLVV